MMSDGRDASASRTTSKGLARRDKIVDTATDLFLEQGYDAVTIDEIVRVVGGSKTSVYRTFGGKEGLLSESVQQMCASFLVAFNQLDVSSLSPADGLKVLGATLMRTLLEDRHIAFQRLIIAVSGRFPELARVWFESGPGRSRATIAAFIGAKQQSGALRSSAPDVLAVQFHDMIVTNALYRALMGEKPAWPEVERSIDAAIDTLLHGCAASDAPSSKA